MNRGTHKRMPVSAEAEVGVSDCCVAITQQEEPRDEAGSDVDPYQLTDKS